MRTFDIQLTCSDPSLLLERDRIAMSYGRSLTPDEMPDFELGAFVAGTPLELRPNHELMQKIIAPYDAIEPPYIELIPRSPQLEKRMYWLAENIPSAGTTHSAPDMIATTFSNVDRKKRVGVHLDDKEHLPLSVRIRDSRPRLAFNWGPGVREIVAARWSILKLLADLNTTSPDYMPSTRDVREWVRRFGVGKLQLLHLRLPPGWAYFMHSSETIVHDGRTALSRQDSRITFWLGERAMLLGDEI